MQKNAFFFIFVDTMSSVSNILPLTGFVVVVVDISRKLRCMPAIYIISKHYLANIWHMGVWVWVDDKVPNNFIFGFVHAYNNSYFTTAFFSRHCCCLCFHLNFLCALCVVCMGVCACVIGKLSWFICYPLTRFFSIFQFRFWYIRDLSAHTHIVYTLCLVPFRSISISLSRSCAAS